MTPFWSTLISAIMLIVGALCLIIQMSVQGRDKLSNPKAYVLAHRILGWIFAALFLLMFFFMVTRIETLWEEVPARIAVHVALAVVMFFLVIVKLLTPRFFPRLNKNLYQLGILLYATCFTLAGITGGYYLVRRIQGVPYIGHIESANYPLDLALGKQLFITDCSTCHSLDRAIVPRSEADWKKVITDMVELANPRIGPAEADQIFHYVTQTFVPKPSQGVSTANPFDKYCASCHPTNSILMTARSRDEWLQIVRKMHEYGPDTVPEAQINNIVDYIMQQQGT